MQGYDEMDSNAPGTPEKHAFQAEVSRLLHLMVHSVYTEKEIFLRELISNASDACDKIRYEALAKPELLRTDAVLRIRIAPDAAAGTLVVSDNGIGMDRDELIDNLGTIARSGTRAFLEKVSSGGKDGGALIGQFGVGFYSAFMVADRVEVVSRKAGSPDTWVWESDGSGVFSVRRATPEDPPIVDRGTVVRLHLKSDARDFLDPMRLEHVVRTYSDHILFPVELAEKAGEWRQLNAASALWHRSKSEVKAEELKELYQTLSGQFDEPRLTLHYRAEGRQTYAVLLFVPGSRPFDLFDPDRKGRVKLYVRRVFITSDAELLPAYLRFVRGVVDSEDVPLNISREMLQNNPAVGQIRKAVTGRVISELETFAAKDAEGYGKLWEAFGAVIKEGLYEDRERRDQLLKLTRFHSTAVEGWRSLADYVAAMRPGQTEIYYLIAGTLGHARSSPQLEAARARGIEVLLLDDPVDSFWTSQAITFEGKKLRSLSQGDVDLSSIPLLDPAREPSEAVGDIDKLLKAVKAALGDAVGEVKASKRLVESPACLVAPGQGPDLGLEKLLQHRTPGFRLAPVLEVNPGHGLVKALAARADDAGGDEFKDLAALLLDQARILGGEVPPDPAQFMARINRFLVKGLGG